MHTCWVLSIPTCSTLPTSLILNYPTRPPTLAAQQELRVHHRRPISWEHRGG